LGGTARTSTAKSMPFPAKPTSQTASTDRPATPPSRGSRAWHASNSSVKPRLCRMGIAATNQEVAGSSPAGRANLLM